MLSALRNLRAEWAMLLAGAIAVATLAAMRTAGPDTYQSEAWVRTAPRHTDVQFEQNASIKRDALAINAERQQSLAELVQSAAIEQPAAQQLQKAMPGFTYQAGELVQHVRGAVKPQSEILGITATADSAEEATAIASAWTQSYIHLVNRIYAQTPGPTLESLVADREVAAAASQAAQDAYTAELRTNRINQLTDQIQQREHQLSQLAPPTTQSTTREAGDYHLLDLTRLNDTSQLLRRIDDARAAIQLLMQASGGRATDPTAANSLALVEAQLVSIDGSLPTSLQISVPGDDDQVTANTLDGLSAALGRAHDAVASELDAEQAQYERDRRSTIDHLNAELRDLRSQAGQEAARMSLLTAQRDLALSTYTTLAKKVEEQQVAEAAASQEVELVADAGPARRIVRSTVGPMISGALLGAVLGLMLALVMHAARDWLPGQVRVARV